MFEVGRMLPEEHLCEIVMYLYQCFRLMRPIDICYLQLRQPCMSLGTRFIVVVICKGHGFELVCEVSAPDTFEYHQYGTGLKGN